MSEEISIVYFTRGVTTYGDCVTFYVTYPYSAWSVTINVVGVWRQGGGIAKCVGLYHTV